MVAGQKKKAEKQIESLKQQLQNTTKRKERDRIKKTIENIRKDAQRKQIGENHSQGNKR